MQTDCPSSAAAYDVNRPPSRFGSSFQGLDFRTVYAKNNTTYYNITLDYFGLEESGLASLQVNKLRKRSAPFLSNFPLISRYILRTWIWSQSWLRLPRVGTSTRQRLIANGGSRAIAIVAVHVISVITQFLRDPINPKTRRIRWRLYNQTAKNNVRYAWILPRCSGCWSTAITFSV